MYRWQSEKKIRFLHEHPWNVSSWSSKPVKALPSRADTTVIRRDTCMFGTEGETDGSNDGANDEQDG